MTGVKFPAGAISIFLSTTTSITAVGPTQPPIKWIPGALSPGVKRLGRKADHSPPLLQYVLQAWCFVKNRDNFIWRVL